MDEMVKKKTCFTVMNFRVQGERREEKHVHFPMSGRTKLLEQELPKFQTCKSYHTDHLLLAASVGTLLVFSVAGSSGSSTRAHDTSRRPVGSFGTSIVSGQGLR